MSLETSGCVSRFFFDLCVGKTTSSRGIDKVAIPIPKVARLEDGLAGD